MHIPLSWLKEFIDIDRTPEELANILTLAGLEVDGIEKISIKAKGVVVAKIIESIKHPEADSLSIAKVTDGKDTYQIVCGAPNCRAGIKVALAKIDATLEDDGGKSFKIKKAKLRGVESFGMLCSAKELGLANESDGILELDESFPEGKDLNEFYNDSIFEISLTPNLGHCSSVLGVARELSAALEIPIIKAKFNLIEDEKKASSLIQVKVHDVVDCPKYACRVVTNVTVGDSPNWLKARLEACGIRSINNIVDVTNYIMLEHGHPLHAFDLNHLDGHQIHVKRAKKGDPFVTLDGKTRILEDHDIVIADAEKAVAIAGVMGGQNSEVSESTKTIVLEAASFSPMAIRKTGKRLAMSTDASKKFERGCDANALKECLNKAAYLIQQIAGGSILKGFVEDGEKEFPKKTIICRLARINQVLGTFLSLGEVENIFQRLEFEVKILENETFSVDVPTYRNDLNEEIDLVEEVARIYQFGNIKSLDIRYKSSEIPHNKMFVFEREMRTRILREGLQEFLTCDLIGPSLLEIVGKSDSFTDESLVSVLNPTSIEQSILRNTLLPGLLQVVKYNIDHQNLDISGFEIGRIHFKQDHKYSEQSVVGFVMSGKSRPHHFDIKPEDVDFYDLKGIIENLLNELKVPKISFKDSSLNSLHPGRQAAVFSGDLKLGTLGEIHPAVQRRLDVSQRVLFAEINLHNLLDVKSHDVMMKPLAIFPGSQRDVTLTLNESVQVDTIINTVENVRSAYLENFSVIDIYRSEKLGAGLKNVTFRFFYRDLEKTISQEQVDAEHHRILNALQNAKLM